jgi:hypothetical protein
MAPKEISSKQVVNWKVFFTGLMNGGFTTEYSNLVEIDHGQGYSTRQ